MEQPKRNMAKEIHLLKQELAQQIEEKIMYMTLYDDAMIEVQKLQKDTKGD